MALVEEDRVLLTRAVAACDRLEVALRDHGRRLARLAVLATVSVGIAVVGLIVGGIGVKAAAEANRASDDLGAFVASTEVERASQRVAACVQFNVQRAETRGAMKLSLRALGPPGVLTPEQMAVFEKYNAAVDLQLPFRDCSPAGLDAYYKSPPPDPAVPR